MIDLAKLEERLWEATRAEVGRATELAHLVPAIQERTRRYTDERHRLGETLRGAAADRDLAARALFFTVADAAKIALPLSELSERGLVPEGSRVLDVGAGPGAMTLGLRAALPDRAFVVTAVDRDARALAILRRVAPDVKILTADVTAPLPGGPFDFVVAGTVLNELAPGARTPLVRGLLERLAPGGAVILVEPALRETSRALHALRDELLGEATVFAPCTHQNPCPALADPRDWCHEDRPWKPPPRLAQLMNRTGLRDSGLKFAYLVLRREPDPRSLAPGAARVVSGALDSKGVVERIVCDAGGRRHLRLLRRDRTPALVQLTRSRRGEVLTTFPAPSPSRPQDPAEPRTSRGPGEED